MININLDSLNDEFFINYLHFLTSKIFKILPISENEPETLREYLDSLVLELKGSQSLIVKIKYDANFISLLSILQYFSENQFTHKEIKREVFKAIKILQGLQEKYCKKEVIK